MWGKKKLSQGGKGGGKKKHPCKGKKGKIETFG